MEAFLLAFVGALTCCGLGIRVVHARELQKIQTIKVHTAVDRALPVTESLLALLRTIGSGRTTCAICFEDFKVSDLNVEEIIWLDCSHIYHEPCFRLYEASQCAVSSRRLRCPECGQEAKS